MAFFSSSAEIASHDARASPKGLQGMWDCSIRRNVHGEGKRARYPTGIGGMARWPWPPADASMGSLAARLAGQGPLVAGAQPKGMLDHRFGELGKGLHVARRRLAQRRVNQLGYL